MKTAKIGPGNGGNANGRIASDEMDHLKPAE
jgi:hypothetical protein